MIKKNVGPILAIFLIGFLAYAFNLNNGLFWDDNDWIVGNIFVHDLSHLKEIFSENILAGFGLNSNYYRPLLLLSFAFNYVISGVKPLGYHLLSNGFHIANAILIFSICYLVFRKRLLALIAGLIFVIHPLQVEAVAYISGRGDPMSVFFMLLALWFFAKLNLDNKRIKLYWSLALGSMVLALLSRETAVLLAPLLLVFYVSFLSQEKFWLAIKRGVYKTWPFFGLALIYTILRLTVLNFQNTLNFYGSSNIYADNLAYRIYTFGHVFLEYLKLIFVPVDLHMERDFTVHTSLFQWPVWLGFLIMAGILGLIFYLYRTKNNNDDFRIWFFGWGWFFVSLSMVSGIVPINAIIYEHWLYLPLVGLSILAAFYLDKILVFISQTNTKTVIVQRPSLYNDGLCRLGKWLIYLILAAYLAFFAVQTVKRNIIWGDPIRFYEEILRYSPDSIRILNNLGNEYSAKGRIDDAIKMYERIISIPGNFYAQPYYNLGNIYRDKKDLNKAVAYYKAAIEKDPNFPFAYQNLGSIYANSGYLVEAIKLFDKVRELKPYDPFSYYNLAVLSLANNNRVQAIDYANRGLSFAAPGSEIHSALSRLIDSTEKN